MAPTDWQSLHALPKFPQYLSVLPSSHRPSPLQHPRQELSQRQATPLQVVPVLQPVHCAPSPPHDSLVLPGRHALPSQQPGHDVVVHTQLVPLHCSPAPHAGPEPQPHVPSLRQVFDAAVRQFTHPAACRPHDIAVGVTHVLLLLQHPPSHVVASHTHASATQCSPGPHAAFAPQ